MKFILGYLRGSKSPQNPSRPILHMSIRADHNGKTYIFERLKRNDAGVVLPELVIHDSDGVHPDVIKALIETDHIIPCDLNGNTQLSELKATGL